MAGTRADKLGGVGRRLTKIYIAGKITGDEGYREKFRRAAETVSGMGCIPLNPAEQPEGMAAQDYMRMCFAMIDIADAVLFLPDWRGSPGAMLEKAYCEYIQKPHVFAAGEAEASKALTAERAEAAEAKENMESAMRALEQVRAELEQVRAELKEEHIRRLEEQMEVRNLEKVLAGRLLAEWKERKVPRTPLGQDAETCKRWMCDGDCPAWMACLGKLGPREQIRELMEAMGYAGGTV